MKPNVGILGLGVYLPEQIRKNDWWPESVVAKWRDKKAQTITRYEGADDSSMTEGLKRTLAALAALGDDPFQGSVERRIMPEEITTTDMETWAARKAIERAGIDKREIDFVFSYTICPEHINVPSSCVVHHNLGLSERCFSLNPDAVCNSFAAQMTLAESFIRSGRARYGLLTQSSALSRLAAIEDPVSLFFGDGATAAIVGPVAEGKGLLGFAHRTDGSMHRALIAGVPGKRWYDEGRAVAYSGDGDAGKRMLFGVADRGKESIEAALEQAGLTKQQVDFYASHQATAWFRPVTQEYFGLAHARSVDTFQFAGSLSAANLPLVLSVAEQKGVLRDGDVVATYCGGTGITWSSLVMRWGGD
jgi:3-oxoacyl-[acyl-carrier-protein] synthase-3